MREGRRGGGRFPPSRPSHAIHVSYQDSGHSLSTYWPERCFPRSTMPMRKLPVPSIKHLMLISSTECVLSTTSESGPRFAFRQLESSPGPVHPLSSLHEPFLFLCGDSRLCRVQRPVRLHHLAWPLVAVWQVIIPERLAHAA